MVQNVDAECIKFDSVLHLLSYIIKMLAYMAKQAVSQTQSFACTVSIVVLVESSYSLMNDIIMFTALIYHVYIYYLVCGVSH